jgi:hypothetical protein
VIAFPEVEIMADHLSAATNLGSSCGTEPWELLFQQGVKKDAEKLMREARIMQLDQDTTHTQRLRSQARQPGTGSRSR